MWRSSSGNLSRVQRCLRRSGRRTRWRRTRIRRTQIRRNGEPPDHRCTDDAEEPSEGAESAEVKTPRPTPPARTRPQPLPSLPLPPLALQCFRGSVTPRFTASATPCPREAAPPRPSAAVFQRLRDAEPRVSAHPSEHVWHVLSGTYLPNGVDDTGNLDLSVSGSRLIGSTGVSSSSARGVSPIKISWTVHRL
jgi:hypothetical protein